MHYAIPLVAAVILTLVPQEWPTTQPQTQRVVRPQVGVQEQAVTPTRLQRSPFHKSVVFAIGKQRQAGKLTMRQAVRLRTAMMSPAFRERAKELAVIQMAFSGGEVPMNEAGFVDQTAIDWEGLATFLERLVPILLQLLAAYGGE